MTNSTNSATKKVIVITGGTGGIGYQAALDLARSNPTSTVVVTGRSMKSAQQAVGTLKEESGNKNVEYALADLSVQQQVHDLAAELTRRFPAIDELVNNAGNLSTGTLETTADGVDKNIAVNVVAPLILMRDLVPALKAASPTGRVQITAGGLASDVLDVNDMEGKTKPGPVAAYSHSKRVMEAMAQELARELEPHGIKVNVVGGGVIAASAMTKSIAFSDMPFIMKMFYPVFRLITREDGGKSARKGAEPVVWAANQPHDAYGTGLCMPLAPKIGKFNPSVSKLENQKAVMQYVESMLK